MRLTFTLFLILSGAASLHAQESKNSFYDSLDQKMIDLDSLNLADVYEMAGNYHYWNKFETSDLIYDYLIEKKYIRTTRADTITKPAGYGTYMALAHLRMLTHEYAQAQEYLELAKLAPQPQHWCGNAAMAQFAMEDAYTLECKLGLAGPSEKTAPWSEFINTAFSEDGYGSPDYAGYGVINYLRAKYTDAEIIYIFRKSRATIEAKEKRENDYSTVVGSFKILNATAHFEYYTEEDLPNDLMALNKSAGDFVMNKVHSWISGY